MHSKRLMPIVISLFAICFATTLAPAQNAPSKSVLIKAGRLLDVKAGIYLTNQGVLVEGDRIKEVGGFDTVKSHAPQNVTIVDLGQAALLPGLIDSHSHLLCNVEGRSSPGGDGGEAIVLMLTRIGAAKRALIGAANAREMLEAGFTAVRNVGHSGINGDAALRDAINEGLVPGPRLQAACRKLTPIGGQAVRLRSEQADAIIAQEFLTVGNQEEARRAARQVLADGADVIKIVVDDETRLLNAGEVRAIVEEAHRARIKVAAHAISVDAIQAAIDGGVDSIEHGFEATEEQFKAMRDKGIFLDPTIWTAQAIRDIHLKPFNYSAAELASIENEVNRFVTLAKEQLKRAARAGVRLAAGSDMWMVYPGKSRGEAAKVMFEAMVDAGLTPLETIRAATANASHLLGWQDRIGGIEAGKFADLIAVPGDPLQEINDLNRVLFVMKGGQVVKRKLDK